MRNLVLALLKYKDHLILLVAVSLSIIILLKNDTPNIHIIRGKFSDTFSIISSPFAWIRSMTYLQEETKLLREKNVQLKLQMESMLQAEAQYQKMRELVGFNQDSSLMLMAGEVVNMGASSNLSSITLDIGSDHGVKVGQPVIIPEGVVGKTVIVGRKTTIVQIINDVNYRLSVRILPSGNAGILHYLSDNICEVRELQKNAEISIGDKVVTSGFSQIYPKNLPVGKVIQVLDDRSSFQKVVRIRIKPNLGALMYVFIVVGGQDGLD